MNMTGSFAKTTVVSSVILAMLTSSALSCSIAEQKTISVHTDEKLSNNTITLTRFDNGAVHFRANMDRNTDGSAKSYHPTDRGAQNILCNGINIQIAPEWVGTNPLVTYARDAAIEADKAKNTHTADGPLTINGVGARGAVLTSKQTCSEFMKLYSEAREARWSKAKKVPQVVWVAIANQASDKPCIQEKGDPAPGYFVSTTQTQDTSKAICDTARYIDADNIFNIVIPKQGFLKEKWGIDAGSAAVAHRGNTDIWTFVGDTGPANRMGEGSTALAQRFPGPFTAKNQLVDYFFFPGPHISHWPDNDTVAKESRQRAAKLKFDLSACLAALG